MENLNTLNGVQSGVVDPTTKTPDSAGASGVVDPKAGVGAASEPKAAETVKPAEPATAAKQGAKEADKPKQTKADNAAFAEMRRKTQELQRQLDEARREREKVDSALTKHFGATGESITDKVDALVAKALNISVDELRARDAIEAQKAKERVKQDPEYVAVTKERDELRTRFAELLYAQDLAAIKAAFPDETAETVDDLGEDFRMLRVKKGDPITAYKMVRAARDVAEPEHKPEPPAMGAVGDQSTPESEYYSADELARLDKNPKLLDDPKILAKAIKSLTRLKHK